MQVQAVTGEHVHQWKRLPIVTLSVTYGCEGCDKAVTVMWTSALPQNLETLDAEFVRHQGGVFAGEMYPQPTPEQIRQRWIEIAERGLP
jgi:hypothetical protein